MSSGKEERLSKGENIVLRFISQFSIWHTRVLWLVSSTLSVGYLLFMYVLPSVDLVGRYFIPHRYFIELIIFLMPVFGAVMTASKHMVSLSPSFEVNGDFLWYSVGSDVVGVSCLDIANVTSSVVDDGQGNCVYDSSFLMALRSGLDSNTNLAFEAGTDHNGPYLRFFLSNYSKSKEIATNVLIREKMKLEAILLSAFKNIEFNPLGDSQLGEALGVSDDGVSYSSDSSASFFVIRGTPKVGAGLTSSQIGTFLSTAMKRGISTQITCVLSAADGGSERKRMERNWNKIKEKEKRKEETLKDWVTKKKLQDRYHETESKSGWFDCSAYVLVNSNCDKEAISDAESVLGLIRSIWGGDNTFSIKKMGISEKIQSRLLTRRIIEKTRLHANSVVAYVNTPVQPLPMMSKSVSPTFNIPSLSEINNELFLGQAIFQGSKVSSVGLSVLMLREHLAVLGATGTGKTTLVKRLMAELSTKTDVPWWIFDVKGSEYSDFEKIDDVMVIRPGLDPAFSIPLIDSSHSSESIQAQSTFSLLRELIREESVSEFSPAMEQLLLKSVRILAQNDEGKRGAKDLVEIVKNVSDNGRSYKMTRDALLNRLEILTREPLGAVLSGNKNGLTIFELLKRRVVFDLRYIARIGGMDAARLLYNLVAKRIFEVAMRRGLSPELNHVVVLEEASNLVPESYTRSSAADVSTGESMVMLQRATGQGVIVVSTRPNISTNILANTATKVAFRLPYDSEVGSRFLSLNEVQERYLRVLKRGRALISLPGMESFEIETDVFLWREYKNDTTQDLATKESKRSLIENKDAIVQTPKDSAEPISGSSRCFNRASEITSQLIAYVASKGFVDEKKFRDFINVLSPKATSHEIDEMVHSLISLGTIVREAIPLVDRGFVYTLPGKGIKAVSEVISRYIQEKVDLADVSVKVDDFNLLIDDIAVVIIGKHIRASSLEGVADYIKSKMRTFGHGVEKLYVVVRGSVAAAKLREQLAEYEGFDSVSVVSAFPSSLDAMVTEIKRESHSTTEENKIAEKETEIELIQAVHDRGSMATRAIQIRMWIGLIQDFIDVSKGKAKWKAVLEFIETTVLQSKRARTVPLITSDGRRAVTELLADEALTAIRVSKYNHFEGFEAGLWIVNSNVLLHLKASVMSSLLGSLKEKNHEIKRNHEYYDLCAGDASYVIFPNQQQLSTLLHLDTDVICRKCNSKKAVCILTASEYFDEREKAPKNLIFRDLNDQQLEVLS